MMLVTRMLASSQKAWDPIAGGAAIVCVQNELRAQQTVGRARTWSSPRSKTCGGMRSPIRVASRNPLIETLQLPSVLLWHNLQCHTVRENLQCHTIRENLQCHTVRENLQCHTVREFPPERHAIGSYAMPGLQPQQYCEPKAREKCIHSV
jgi:hypothetical protein